MTTHRNPARIDADPSGITAGQALRESANDDLSAEYLAELDSRIAAGLPLDLERAVNRRADSREVQ